MNVDMRQFLESFFDEANEHVENMEAALLQLENSPDDAELLNTIFRAAHSIKGASSTFGVHAVGEFTHVLENLLDRMRDGEIQVTSESTEVLLTSVDVLSGLLAAARDGSAEPENTAEVVASLQEINGGESAPDKTNSPDTQPSTESTPTLYDVVFEPSRDFFHIGLDPLMLLSDLHDCGTVSNLNLDASKLPSLAEMDPESCYLSWTLTLESECSDDQIRDVFMTCPRE